MSWGFRNKWTAQQAAALVRQQPPSQFVQPASEIVSRSFVIRVPDAGIPGLTRGTGSDPDKPGEADCEAYFSNADGELEKMVTQPGSGEFKITCINLSEQAISPDKDDQDQPIATYLPAIQLGKTAIVIAPGGGGEELDVLTSLSGNPNGQLCAEKKRIKTEVISTDPQSVCVDLCDVIKCCDTLVTQPDECQSDPCDPCIFFDIAYVHIQDSGGSYVNSENVTRLNPCAWEVPMQTDPGGNYAGIAAWNHSNVVPDWAYDFNGAFRGFTYRSRVYTAVDGCSLELSLDPQTGDGISWLMRISGRLTDTAILPQVVQALPDSPIDLLRQACGCQGNDALALIRRWGKDKSMAQIDELLNLLILGAAKRGKTVSRDELLAALMQVIDDAHK